MNRRSPLLILCVCAVALGATAVTVALAGGTQAPTTLRDYFQPGSQPTNEIVQYDSFRPSSNCIDCHESDGIGESVVFPPWQGSMMAQAAREGKGAVQVDGRLVDIANIRMAQNLLQKADAIGGS